MIQPIPVKSPKIIAMAAVREHIEPTLGDQLEYNSMLARALALADRELYLELLCGDADTIAVLSRRDYWMLTERVCLWEEQRLISHMRTDEDSRWWFVPQLWFAMSERFLARRARCIADGEHYEALWEIPAFLVMHVFLFALTARYAFGRVPKYSLWSLRLIVRYLAQ